MGNVLATWARLGATTRGKANAVTYGCMIDACVKCNHLDVAMHVFEELKVQEGGRRHAIRKYFFPPGGTKAVVPSRDRRARA